MKRILSLFLMIFAINFFSVSAISYDYTVNCIVDANGNIVNTTDKILENEKYSIMQKEFKNVSDGSNTSFCVGKLVKKDLSGSFLLAGEKFNEKLASAIESTNVISISFTNIAIPSNVTTVDYSEAQDGSILGFRQREFYYITSVSSDGKIIANTDSSYMFYGLSNLKELYFSNLDTSSVTNMKGMFSGCSSLTSLDLSNFDTSNVTNMNSMFATGEYDWGLPDRYAYSSYLTSIIFGDNWNTSNVTEMKYMFLGCSALTELDLSKFNTSKVVNMTGMFEYCRDLTSLNLSGFDTKVVTDMSAMFEYCLGLTTLYLSSFNTNNVTNMNNMFYYCPALTTIYASSLFIIDNVTLSSEMFYNCTELVGGAGTKFNSSYTNKTYAKIDTTSTPGYFTQIIDTSTLYIGSYADIDGDGTVDGVIFADLAFDKSGQWYWTELDWSYTAQTDLKDYYISQESYTGKFGPAAVISPVEGTTGNDRFYVMALTDIDGKQNGTLYDWYDSASDFDGELSFETGYYFGDGKQNTIKTLAAWNNSTYGSQSDNDLWGNIKDQVNNGWFVPSPDEWAAFGSALRITSSNYSLYGLSENYWASAINKYYYYNTYVVFSKGYIYSCSFGAVKRYVRLATSF